MGKNSRLKCLKKPPRKWKKKLPRRKWRKTPLRKKKTGRKKNPRNWRKKPPQKKLEEKSSPKKVEETPSQKVEEEEDFDKFDESKYTYLGMGLWEKKKKIPFVTCCFLESFHFFLQAVINSCLRNKNQNF